MGILKESELIFFVNGKKIIDTKPDPEQTLLYYLRNTLRLCGTKLGCGEGGCGACTVMISKYDRDSDVVNHFAVNACLTPVCSVHGTAITTVEGIGSTKEKLHPVQERIANAHGSQCGFCTPGIVMSMYALIRNLDSPSTKDLEVAFQGNLCRCTGYRPILEGYWSFTQEAKQECAMGKNCCKLKSGSIENGVETLELFNKKKYIPVDTSQEPIFPPELKISDKYDNEYLFFKTERVSWYRPTNLQQLLELKLKHPNAKIVVGNTEIGVEMKFKYMEYPHLISPSLVKELYEIKTLPIGIILGAAVCLNTINVELSKQIKALPKYRTRIYSAVTSMLHYFAGKQIRNVASIGGNIMTGSPISDLNPILMAASAELKIAGFNSGIQTICMDDNFYTGYRKSRLNPEEILLSIRLPETSDNEYFFAFKQAKRREDDIAIVNIAIYVKFRENTKIIETLRIAYGGMAPTTVIAKKSAQSVIGLEWNEQIVERINQNLIEEMYLPPTVPGGMVLYRKSLSVSLFFKGFLKISQELEKRFHEKIISSDKHNTGSSPFETLEMQATQLYEIRAPDSKNDKVGATKVHLSAYKQASGEAVYVDDMPHYNNELYAAYVLSTKAHADIKSIDASKALRIPGVHAFYSASDLTPKQNSTGPIVHDEEIFISKTVTSCGQALGLIIADNQILAQRAARQVKIEYDEKLPIVTIEDAIKHNSYINPIPNIVERGNIDEITKADIIFEDEFRMGGQEHFYLETNATIAIPRDPDELEIISSTQHPTETQKLVSNMLGIVAAKINVKVKRLGGGFGGKESRAAAIALPIAFAAYKLQRPIRIMLDRDEDMMMTGTRHPFLFKYKVGCTKEGKLIGCDIKIYNNAGYSTDLSLSVLDRSMLHFENAYYIPNVRVQGWSCKTNITTCTAFRGFGGPQGMMVAEHIIRRVAELTRKDYLEVMELNMYRKGLSTHYNQTIEDSNLLRCYKEILTKSNYFGRKSEIEKYNSLNRWKKRGISVVPTKFGIAYTALFLNQGGALVHVYSDGSVLISHGGTEMGQGLHTKMIQVASRCLNVPGEKIHIAETATDKVPNTSPTAASVSSDINGMAVVEACQKILARLEPIKQKHPDKNWDFWVSTAYFSRIGLSATGFHATPGIGPGTGNIFNYYTKGAACSEVEIDCLTGDHQVIRTDIIMDLGSSLNPAIDIGQIEGGFMQGYGLFTLEEMIYSPNGTLYSRGPGMYKIPGFGDIPGEFNVSLLTNAPNPKAVYSSKAVGEPPLFLASSIFFAIKEAISAARKDAGYSINYKFNSPATSARIRTACVDQFTELFDEPADDTYVPWNIMP